MENIFYIVLVLADRQRPAKKNPFTMDCRGAGVWLLWRICTWTFEKVEQREYLCSNTRY